MEEILLLKPPEIVPEEIYASTVIVILVFIALWRFGKILPKVVKPILHLWVNNQELRSYSLLQLLLAIYYFKSVNEKEYPDLNEAFKQNEKIIFWFTYSFILLLFGGLIYRVSIYVFSNYLIQNA